MDFEGNVDADQDLLEKLDYSICQPPSALYKKRHCFPEHRCIPGRHEESGHPSSDIRMTAAFPLIMTR